MTLICSTLPKPTAPTIVLSDQTLLPQRRWLQDRKIPKWEVLWQNISLTCPFLRLQGAMAFSARRYLGEALAFQTSCITFAMLSFSFLPFILHRSCVFPVFFFPKPPICNVRFHSGWRSFNKVRRKPKESAQAYTFKDNHHCSLLKSLSTWTRGGTRVAKRATHSPTKHLLRSLRSEGGWAWESPISMVIVPATFNAPRSGLYYELRMSGSKKAKLAKRTMIECKR